MIGLIDANNFFVSCERSVNPDLEGKPVVVLSNNDGCIISRSNEVKELGVPMGAPLFQYRDILKKHDTRIFSVNFDLYQHCSTQVTRILSGHVEKLEVYSIDESFIIIGDSANYLKWANELAKLINDKTGIPVSIGIAPTKTLAKIANHQAKDAGAPASVITKAAIQSVLSVTPIGSVWGIGSRIATKLRRNNVHTGYAFTKCSDHWIRKEFGVTGLRIRDELLGLSSNKVGGDTIAKKGISSTRSFGDRVTESSELHSSLVKHLQVATRKLRRQRSVTGRFGIFIRTAKYDSGIQYYGKAYQDLIRPTDNLLELAGLVSDMLHKVYRPDLRYYKSGVCLLDIKPRVDYENQLGLFDENIMDSKVMSVLDVVQARYGEHILRPACIPKSPKWSPRAAYKSCGQSFDRPDNLPAILLAPGLCREGMNRLLI